LERPRRLILIPAYNEEKTIKKVVTEALNVCEVCVIDDSSQDKTGEIAKSSGAKVIRPKHNLGYEEAIGYGINWAMKKRYEFVITMDADGQHSISDVKKTLQGLDEGYKISICERQLLPRSSEKIISFFTRFFFNLSDIFCGLKGYSLKNFHGVEFSTNMIGSSYLKYAQKNKFEIKKNTILVTDREDNPRFGNSVKTEFKILTAGIRFITN
tara:strand:- start:575 stop:1210 length:636 start_codon:yes stop_codon:yes gene_type:complete